MTEPIDRGYLLARAAQLFGESWRGTKLIEMPDVQLESLIADTEMSESFWELYDKEVREMARSSLRKEEPGPNTRPHQILGFDTADLDGQ